MRAWLAVAMIAMALSGCADEGTTVPVTESETGTNETTEPTPPAQVEEEVNVTNEPPVANLTADLVNGSAPLNVTFTIDGSDADGDELAWVLSVNEEHVANGTRLPAVVVYNFTQAGNFSVVLEVTDGNHTTAANLTISVTLPASEGWSGSDPLVYEGETVAVDPLYAVGVGCWITYQVAPTGDGYNMGADHGGWTYKFEGPGHEAEFYDSSNEAYLGGGSSGTVPAGAHYVDVCAAGPDGIDSEYVLTIYPPGHPEA